jgi:hypothetical protein
MGFLGDLNDQISSQFSIGENTTTSLDGIVDGQQTKYGSLGDFASQFDQSAERRYVEEGYLRRDPYNTNPKQSEVLWQEPNATVLIKKRMFSSIAENFRPDFMDADEKLYYKAMRILLQNKCRQVAALEKLSKIQKMTAAVGDINDQLVPVIITLADTANNGFGNGTNVFGALPGNNNPFATKEGGSFIKTVDRLRVLYAYNQTNPYTTWITDPTDLYQSTLGTGTGVIEITNFTNISSTTTTDIKTPGRFSLSISDPYEAMLITEYDIEVALSDATNLFYNKKIFQFGSETSNKVIVDQQSSLNAIRNARKASPITFKIDADTLFGKRVTVIIDRMGIEIPFTYDALASLGLGGSGGVEVTADYLKDGNIAGYDGLDTGPGYTGFPWEKSGTSKSHGNSELQIFQAIVGAIFHQLELTANSAGNFTANNKLCNYARRKLRFNFAGKLIIQPMDVVSIYMSSKSQYDNKILAGMQEMFSGVGILQNITNTMTSLNNATDILFNPSANISVQAEKSMYVGPNFPNYLWALVRTQFVTEKEGTHVFGGVVESAIDNWSNGKFSVDVSGSDNSYYFRQGKINFKPGADAFNGLIFDPLTPFESNFDSITINNNPGTLNLLEENKYLLSSKGSDSLVKHKQGALAGEKATDGNYIQDQSIDGTTGRLTRVFYAPDGLVYKWKQGIGVFTQSGSSNTINDPNLVGTPNIYKEPFAGLDIMNVLSLLITGTPYNFATYYKATSDLFGFSSDPQSKQSSANNFIKSLRTSLSKSNSLWGNFIPFKNLVMNEKAVAQSMQSQMTAANNNSDLDAKIKRLSDLQNSLAALGAADVLSKVFSDKVSPVTQAQISTLSTEVIGLTSDINKILLSTQASNQQFYSQVESSNNQTSSQNQSSSANLPDSVARKELRRQTNYLTRRMSYDVRANQDKNLFIVDDYYDMDYDIAAFNKALANSIDLYSTEYTDVSTKIAHVADLLNLEVFCDSQGHVRVRSPQYNRMPSSVFYRMLYLKKTLGIQVFPHFLDSLFTDQLTSLRRNIEVLEDQIRLDCAILGHYSGVSVDGDNEASQFITETQVSSGMGGTFNFISNSSGSITDIHNLVSTANQDQADGKVKQDLSSYNNLVAAATSTKQLFGNTERYIIIFSSLVSQNDKGASINTNSSPSTSVFQSSNVQVLISRIEQKSGTRVSSKDYLTKAGPNQPIEVDTGQTVDIFKVTEDLTSYIQQWQTAVKLFYHTMKNAAEYKSLDDNTANFNAISNPGLHKNAYIPEIYEHMIEDESYDDYGPGSGTRYVIKRAQIRNISISENAPPYTMVEVHGTLPFFAENEGPPGLNAFPGQGNALVTAIAVDYDMWRNYGYKDPYPINVPFLTDPVSQLGPYASMILSRNRYNILRGTLTISGNEFMQPGEVIYLEDRNLLFYVTSVSHSLSQGSGFTTTLELSYGHPIGEYIPTVMDSIGKLIYKNQEATNTIIHRQDSSANEESLGVIQLDGKSPKTPTLNVKSDDQNNTNSYISTNKAVIDNLLYTSAYVINANETSGNNVKASIQLRIYYDNKHPINSHILDQANMAQQILIGQAQSLNSSATMNRPHQNNSLPDNTVNIVQINLDNENDRRSPSQKAIDAARDQVSSASIPMIQAPSELQAQNSISSSTTAANMTSVLNDQLRIALFSYIVDCWIIFEQVPTEIANAISSQTHSPSQRGVLGETTTTATNGTTSTTSTIGALAESKTGPGF